MIKLNSKGLWWCSRQSKHLSPLRTWVRFSLVVGFNSRVSGFLGFLPQGKLTGLVRINVIQVSVILDVIGH